MSMNSHIRSFIHQHNLTLGKGAADRPSAGSLGVDGMKTHRKSPSDEQTEKFDVNNSQAKFQCIKSKREAQGTKVGPRMFPLNQCTNFSLHDTKHSVRVSVRFAVQDYTTHLHLPSPTEDHDPYETESYRNYTTEPPRNEESEEISRGPFDEGDFSRSQESDSPLNAIEDPDFYDYGADGGQGEVRGSSESVNSMPSISSLKPGPNSEDLAVLSRFNKMLNDKMALYLQEKFGQSHPKKELTDAEKEAENAAVEEAVIFCTNLFLQEFKSSDPAVICEEFLELKKSGELKELLHDIFQDLIEKMESLKFDQFQDFVIESLTFNRPLQKPENPEIYDKFRGIWALNNESFLEIDLEILLMYCNLGQERQFSYFTSAERFYNELEEAAVRMNLVKFFYTYKWELMKQRKKRLDKRKILSDLDHILGILNDGIDKYMRDVHELLGQLSIRDDPLRKRSDMRSSNDDSARTEAHDSTRKKKLLRFTDELCVG